VTRAHHPARARALALLPAGALAALLLTGCGGHAGSAEAPGATTPPAPGASDLAHMQKLVDDADSAAAVADSDAAADR
jgi:hypothetical protein